MGLPRHLYFVDRGERPSRHAAPYHRHLLCTDQHRAFWEAGNTGAGAHVWFRGTASRGGEGFLLLRWRGLDIDYYPVVGGPTLPDGTAAGFVHPHRDEPPWSDIRAGRAVWWSEKQIPGWLADLGVRPPDDEFSREKISRDVPAYSGARIRVVFPGKEILEMADWLDDEGFAAAAQALRDRFGR